MKAIAVFGETDRSAALIQTLGYDRPSEWDEDEAGEEEGEGGEEGRLRPMCGEDVPRCLELMRARAHRFDLAPIWSKAAWPE